MDTSAPLADRFRELRVALDAIPDVSEPPKSTLRILGMARREQQWNTLLAYFLDPTEPHGFGTTLLERFLDVVAEHSEKDLDYYHRDLESVRIDTEITSPQNNRLDIAIRVADEWFVWVELKVDSSEGHRQTKRYIEDTHIGNEEKADYPASGHHYVFVSKRFTPDATAAGFVDIAWQDVVEAFQEELRRSQGRYPERSVGQLSEFLATIRTVTHMEDDDFTETQKEKVRLLGDYRSDIDELLAAADALRQRAIEDWPELFREQLDDELWTDEWTLRKNPREWGCIFKHGWYLTDDGLEPTIDSDETHGSTGLRLHFNHLIRNEESFSRGTLTYRLRCPTSVPLRDEFHRLYNSDEWQAELAPLLEERGITNKGNKKNYMVKTYDVDQGGLPESYFRTLATAFEEHRPIADVIDEIVVAARRNLADDGV